METDVAIVEIPTFSESDINNSNVVISEFEYNITTVNENYIIPEAETEQDFLHDVNLTDFLDINIVTEETECINEELIKNNNIIQIKRRKKLNYSKTKNQLLRQHGKEYEGVKKSKNEDSCIVIIPERKLREICKSDFCKTASNRHCHDVPETERQQIFESFWKCSWPEKRYFVRASVDSICTKRPSKFCDQSRKVQNQYFLRVEGRRLQVCLKTFLCTLDIGDAMLRNYLDDSKFISSGIAALGQGKPKRKCLAFLKAKEHAETLLTQLPKMESHYSRENCDKHFLQEDFSSIRHVHR